MFNQKLTRPKLFQTERTRFMHLLSLASLLVFASVQKVTPQKLITTYPDLTIQDDSVQLKWPKKIMIWVLGWLLCRFHFWEERGVDVGFKKNWLAPPLADVSSGCTPWWSMTPNNRFIPLPISPFRILSMCQIFHRLTKMAACRIFCHICGIHHYEFIVLLLKPQRVYIEGFFDSFKRHPFCIWYTCHSWNSDPATRKARVHHWKCPHLRAKVTIQP